MYILQSGEEQWHTKFVTIKTILSTDQKSVHAHIQSYHIPIPATSMTPACLLSDLYAIYECLNV